MSLNILLAKMHGRVPKYSSGDRDIGEQLNYVASQLPGACRRWQWGEVHAKPLYDAAREIRRLRALIYTPNADVPVFSRPLDQFIGVQTAQDPATYFLDLHPTGKR